MAQRRPVAARDNCSGPPLLPGRWRARKGVDTSVELDQAPGAQPMLDRLGPETQLEQSPAAKCVLAQRDPCYLLLKGRSGANSPPFRARILRLFTRSAPAPPIMVSADPSSYAAPALPARGRVLFRGRLA